MIEFTGRAQSGFFGWRGGGLDDPFPYHIGLFVDVAFFAGCLIVGLWNALRWGKEAEEYEADLKEADEIEKERRRKSS